MRTMGGPSLRVCRAGAGGGGANADGGMYPGPPAGAPYGLGAAPPPYG
jgi:hypothetical protein